MISFVYNFFRLISTRITVIRTGALLCAFGLMFVFSTPVSAALVINEFMASNDSTLNDEDGEYSDWVELHNNGGSSVDVSNWYLTDDQGDLTQWQFPSTSIAAGDYLLVYASGKDRAVSGAQLHTNFKLSSGGEYLGLVSADGVTVVDAYAPEYPQQFTDISFGGNQYYNNPTPAGENNAGVNGIIEPVNFSLEHGFYSSTQSLNLSTTTANAEIRYTLDGRTPSSNSGCTPPADGSAWQYEYYQGTWSVLPNFDTLTPISTGTSNTISTAPRQRDDLYALRFKGCIEASEDGLYDFSTTSDDGSQLHINGQLVVNNDGLHGPETVTNTLALDKGLHSVVVTMFERTGGDTLSAQWSSPTTSNAYVTSVNNGVIVNNPAGSADFIEFEFDLPTSGLFSFDARVQGTDDGSNSFWVQLNNGPFQLFDTTVSNDITNQMVSDRSGGVVAQSLAAGEHRLRFYLREDGTRLDSVNVIGANCNGPCESQLLEAEAASLNGRFLAAGRISKPLQGAHWFTYNNPITIDSTTTVRAVAIRENFLPAKAVTQSYLFVDDIINQSASGEAPDGWPAGSVNGQLLNYGMDPEIVNSNQQAVKDALTGIPSVSIVTDLDHLLDPALGIYVNAQNKGRYWERPVSVELIDPNGQEAGFTQDAGLRVRGGFSRTDNNPKHAFRLFFRGSYGGDLEYPLFGDEGTDVFEKVDLRTAQNYSWSFRGDNRNTFLREVFSRDTQGAMGHTYTKSRYYHLYINGIYWGLFMSQERVSKEFASSYSDSNEDNFDVIKHNRSDNFRYEATDGSNGAWNSLWNYVSDQFISTAEYNLIAQTVDLNNLADYIMINAYEGDFDGSPSWFLGEKRGNNWYAVFDRTDPNSKWSFYQHDGEHSLGARREPAVEENRLGPSPPFNGQFNEFFTRDYFHPYWLHAALVSNPDYRQVFIDRAGTHFATGGALTTESVLARWNAREAQVAPAIIAESARWGDAKRAAPFTVTDWQNEVNYVENSFFPSRSQTVLNQLLAQGLASTLPIPQFSLPSGSVIEPGTQVTLTNTTGGMLYYTLDGSDPRLPGGGISPNALLLLPGQSITITGDVNIRIRYYDGVNWGPISNWNYTTNQVPVISAVQNQISTNGMSVNLDLTASDDDTLTWSASNLPDGLAIDADSGKITGTLAEPGMFTVTVMVNDGTVTADTSFGWWVVPQAKLILNEYNGVSDSKYLGGGDNTVSEPSDARLGRIAGNGGNWFELVVIEDHLDVRGWQLSIVDDGGAAQVLTFSNSAIWLDLRAGTIITISDSAITAANSILYVQDTSYSPTSNDWWIHVVTGTAGSGEYITAGDISVSNKNWQLEIIDSAGQNVFGPAGEGIGLLSGVNSEEVGKLEQDPQLNINPGAAYNDGTSSTFGGPNSFNAGTVLQDLSDLRSVVSTDINLLGQPLIDGSGESGVFIWRENDGRTLVQVVAGDPAENGQSTAFAGSITSASTISSLLPLGLESSDSLNQSASDRVDFELIARRPWNDRFSFVADANESLCVDLSSFAGGLFLGPDKAEVTPPYDIHGLKTCDNNSIEVDGAPSIDKNIDVGWFIWRENGIWHNRFVTGGTTHRYDGSISSSAAMSNLEPISIETSDALGSLPATRLNFSLRVINPYMDGFNLEVNAAASTCVSLTSPGGVSIYLGPDRVEMPSSFDLKTLGTCQAGPGIETLGKPSIDRTADKGIFLWERASNDWSVEVVTGATTASVIDIDVLSQQVLSNVAQINIEPNDVFTALPRQLDLSLRVRAPWYDGFEFSVQAQSATCVSTPTPLMPIYLGPDRVEVGSSVNLDTNASCQ